MNRKLIIIGLLVLVFILSNSILAAPRLTIKESIFKFGFAPQNSKISHVFWLYSTGEDSLKILKVVPG
jgi:hypothetical protein